MILLGALGLGLALTPVAASIARRTGVVDRPGALKVHDVPVPYLGGVAILAAAAPFIARNQPRVLVPLVAALAIGVADDARGLSARSRLVAEAVVGLAVAWAVDSALPDVVHVAVAVLAVIVLANGVNVIDGLDGLAGGVSLAALAGLVASTDGDARVTALALAGAVAGFLWHNKPPARIYLGDGGSYLLGTALALLAVSALARGRPVAAGVAAALAVAFPVIELTVAVARRALAHRPLLAGDRAHTYDRLVDRGWSRGRATLACVAAAAMLSMVGAIVSVSA